MKKLLLIVCALISFGAQAQTIYLADTAFVTDAGAGGAPASCKTNGMTYNALTMDRPTHTWVADVFTIPAGATWTFDTVVVFGYQYNSGFTSPFLSCNLEIYNGAPGLGGNVIWGDTVTNVLNSSSFTGIFKVDTFASDSALLSTKRPIMRLNLHLSPAPTLSSGTYWLAWSAAGINASTPCVTPYKVLPGRINPPGQMARQYAGGTWYYADDNSNAVGLNKIIAAKAGITGVSIPVADAKLTAQIAPNPCTDQTTVAFTMPNDGNIKVTVYDIVGHVITTLVDGTMSAGKHELQLDATNITAGMYYIKLSTAEGETTMPMVRMK